VLGFLKNAQGEALRIGRLCPNTMPICCAGASPLQSEWRCCLQNSTDLENHRKSPVAFYLKSTPEEQQILTPFLTEGACPVTQFGITNRRFVCQGSCWL